jgi:STE24 endopeptidase
VNPFAAIVLAALLGEFLLHRLADLANLRALAADVPSDFRDAYDPVRYRDSQRYLRARTRLDMIASTTALAAVLGFWAAGGFPLADAAARVVGSGPVTTGLAFIGFLGAGRLLLGLPFRWWSTFVVEARFGFNRTTPGTFWTDLAKGIGLAIALGGPLVAAVLWLFATHGPAAWVWCWVVSTLAVLAVQFVAPAWLMPLFNTFTPVPPGTLRDAILEYARAVDFPLAGVFVIDGSRRSTKANAFFAGFGRHRRIALFDTLLAKLDLDAIRAVVAHEVGHWKLGHVLVGLGVAVTQLGVTLFVLSRVLVSPGLADAFLLAEPSTHAGLVLGALLLAPLELVLSPLALAWSRRNEYAADGFAVRTTGLGEALARGLTRLAADALANLTPHPLYVALHYTHPPLPERVAALRRATSSLTGR